MLTDTHCHLDFDKFTPDRAEVLARAEAAGVARMLIPSTSVTSSRDVIRLAESDPHLYAAVGVHPNEALTWDTASVSTLRESCATNLKVVAIGEIGLDYYWDAAPHELQQHALGAQLDLAGEIGLPVILHLREKGDLDHGPCAKDMLSLLAEWTARLRACGSPLTGRPGVLHSFSGSLETALRAVELGFFIGVTGPVTYRKDRQALIRALPLDRLLVETDAPFLTPVPHRGRRNEPAFVRLVSDKIAELHSLPAGLAAEATSANAARLFYW
jgi:TatD DNase family protein